MAVKQFDTIVAHAKNSGFVFQGSEIYGGLSNTWDFGPLGVELKDNIKRAWWKKFIQSHPNNVGIQAAILMNPKVWEASGHLKGFSDPLMDCRHCKTRHRADHLIEEATEGKVVPEGWSNEKMMDFIKENHIACPNCGSHDFTDIRQFNLMFKTFQGILEDAKSTIYLRPETAQGMFVNFKNVHAPQAALWHRSDRQELPQRDHAGQLHFPDPGIRADGNGIFLQAGRGFAVVRILEKLLHELADEPGPDC